MQGEEFPAAVQERKPSTLGRMVRLQGEVKKAKVRETVAVE